MVVAALITVIVFVVTYLYFPVTGVQVVGARMYPESQAWDAVPDRASLLTLNAASLEQNVETNPWVKGAEVTKNWESGIVMVEVQERYAILDAEVNGLRVVVAMDGEELPGLGGADLGRVELDEDQLGEVLEFARVLEGNGVRLDSIDEAGTGGIQATAEGRRVFFSGGVEEEQARALKEIMSEHPEAGIFDLRTAQRVVVGGPSSGEPAG